jgi:hypothetical protein
VVNENLVFQGGHLRLKTAFGVCLLVVIILLEFCLTEVMLSVIILLQFCLTEVMLSV